MKKRIVIPGGSGFLGRSLAAYLIDRRFEVVILTRHPAPGGSIAELPWDAKSQGDWAAAIDGAEAIVNMTGKSVNCRYNAANRKEIVESRVDSVRALGEAISRCKQPPKVFIQAASLAIYGDTRELCDESAPLGSGFSPEVCRAWEGAFNALKLPATRKALFRIGFVLGKDGGALKTLGALAKCFLGGTVGSGRQMISWLHIDDLNAMLLWAIENPAAQGLYNAASPHPVANADFMRALRRALHRPWSPPVPAFAVRIGSFLMGTESELALHGRNCVPAHLLAQGFQFDFLDLDRALSSIYRAVAA